MYRGYDICGLSVQLDLRHETMLSRSEKYLCEDRGHYDIDIPYFGERIAEFCKRQPHISVDSAENMLTAEAFYTYLLMFEGFMLHSSAVVVDGRAYLFSAPSGTGKSTHTSLWLKAFGERAYILNDDKPALRFVEGEVIAYGTPWSGKSDLNVNTGVPVQGICVLERSDENFIEPLDEGTAVYSILNQTIRPSQPKGMELLLSHLDRLITSVPVWRMGCNISEEAAVMSYETMSKNH